MNTKILSLNISEAFEELKKINDALDKKSRDETDFYLKLQAIYHHLNVAWNAKNIKTEQYGTMSGKEFEDWGKFPHDFKSQKFKT